MPFDTTKNQDKYIYLYFMLFYNKSQSISQKNMEKSTGFAVLF